MSLLHNRITNLGPTNDEIIQNINISTANKSDLTQTQTSFLYQMVFEAFFFPGCIGTKDKSLEIIETMLNQGLYRYVTLASLSHTDTLT